MYTAKLRERMMDVFTKVNSTIDHIAPQDYDFEVLTFC